MAFGAVPRSSDNIPISSVYVPGVGFVALQGSTTTNTDGSTNTSTSAVLALTAANTVSGTLQNAQAGSSNGTSLSVLGMASVVFTVNQSGFTGTINFEVSEDGTNYDPLTTVQSGTSTIGTTVVGSTTTSIHLYEASCAGMQLVRARTSGVGAGNVTVTAHAMPINLAPRIVNANIVAALPAGTNVIGSTTIQATSGTALLADQSNTELRASLYGKNSTAGDTAIKLNSVGDQYVLGDFSESAGLSAGSLNADLVASTDVSAYQDFTLTVSGTWSGTLTVQFSNDNSNFTNSWVQATTSSTWTQTMTANGQFYIPRRGRYLRIRMTAYSSGTANGVLEANTLPNVAVISTVNAAQSGTWTAQPGNTPNTTPWLIAFANNNASVATGAANTVVKNAAGGLATLVVTTTGSGAGNVQLFDNASTNSGTVLFAFPATVNAGTSYPIYGWAKNGITAQNVASGPVFTVYYA